LIDTYYQQVRDDNSLPISILDNVIEPKARDILHDSASEIEPLLRRSRQVRLAQAPDEWETFNTRSLLGESLLIQQKYTDAESMLLSGYEGMKKRTEKIPTQYKIRLGEAVDRLCTLYTALGKKEEVVKWRAERSKYPPEQAPSPREVK
jgi:eukaryotic-like serine/threonine-protein kinase